jgi:hypothetical protein
VLKAQGFPCDAAGGRPLASYVGLLSGAKFVWRRVPASRRHAGITLASRWHYSGTTLPVPWHHSGIALTPL